MAPDMEWAEIFAQIGNAARSVFAAEDFPKISADNESGTENPSAGEESPTENANAAASSADPSSAPIGGATLPKPEGLSFAPLWVSAKAVRPARGNISSGFGLRVNPVTGELGWHGGIDIAAPEGAEILAAYAGTVEKISADAISGSYVLLNHGGSFRTFYCHASKILVSEGETVTAGQQIALVGSTGQATGPHLHVELRLNGLCYDPSALLNQP
jgi:murein DD-endopeptidase MepM/ murein hydrolase activator NlpD